MLKNLPSVKPLNHFFQDVGRRFWWLILSGKTDCRIDKEFQSDKVPGNLVDGTRS